MRIVYLIFAPNSAYNQVVDKAPKGVKVDEAKGTWQARDLPYPANQEYKIGRSRYIERSCLGGVIIGVYDADNLEHLGSMVHAAVESHRDYRDAD